MLDTAESMYLYFLKGIRKERNTTVTPAIYTGFINPIILDWIKTKLPETEFSQKRIDDLEAIKVVTDQLQYAYIHSANPHNVFEIPYRMNGYPPYMHGISASFRWENLGSSAQKPPDTSPLMSVDNAWNPDANTKPSWDKTKIKDRLYRAGDILRGDNRVRTRFNPYRQPNTEYVYFEQRGNRIVVHPDEENLYNLMELEYYSYPKEISYGTDNDSTGSFKSAQNKEILDMAITRYLERVSDQRIQTQPSVDASVPK